MKHLLDIENCRVTLFRYRLPILWKTSRIHYLPSLCITNGVKYRGAISIIYYGGRHDL